jgi:hypothetical protein
MKFSFATIALLPAVAFAQRATWDSFFDNSSNTLNNVACSDGANGLLTKGYTTFGSLPSFPYIGGASAVEWNSPNCGTCWEITYTNPKGVPKTIHILAIDTAGQGYNLSKEAMDELTGGQADELGSVAVTSKKVASSVCGM